MRKNAGIECNEKMLRVSTYSIVGNMAEDPLGEDIYLGLDADLYSIGDAVLKALDKSRDLSISAEDLAELNRLDFQDVSKDREWVYERYPERKLFDNKTYMEYYLNKLDNMMKTYKFRSKKAFYTNMQRLYIYLDDNLLFDSWYHESTEGWGDPYGKTPSIKFSIPSSSSVEVVGAAAKYAIGNCRGKGADLIRGILFPEGQPESFEDYLKGLELSV